MSLKKKMHREKAAEKMRNWVDKNKTNGVVKQWIRDNPRPKSFDGSRVEWAYENMPERPS